MKKRAHKTLSLAAVTFCIICVTALCISITVKSMELSNQQAVEDYYREHEKEMLQNTRAMLEEEGYRNSGVTVTRVVAPEDKRKYTITIHHRKIKKLSAEEQKCLLLQLADTGFQDKDCEFQYVFLDLEQSV